MAAEKWIEWQDRRAKSWREFYTHHSLDTADYAILVDELDLLLEEIFDDVSGQD